MIYGEHEPKIAPLALLFFPMIIGSILIQGEFEGNYTSQTTNKLSLNVSTTTTSITAME